MNLDIPTRPSIDRMTLSRWRVFMAFILLLPCVIAATVVIVGAVAVEWLVEALAECCDAGAEQPW